MSEVLAITEDMASPEPAAHDGVTGGMLLRQAREASGLHIAALAVSLKVPVRKLEALEQDRYDQLTDPVFIRALASSVCRALKVDARPILDRLPQTGVPKLLGTTDRINTPFRAPGDGAPPTLLQQLGRPVPLTVMVLLLGVVVMLVLPAFQQGDKSVSVVPSPTSETAPGSPATGTIPSKGVSVPVGTVPAKSSDVRTVTTVVQPNPVASPEATPVAAPVEGSAPLTTAATEASTPAGGIVVFRARAPSWVEVTDANGVVAVRRLLAAGESAGAAGAMPLQVTVGRADATEVDVRGKPMDLRSVARDNVARFEIK